MIHGRFYLLPPGASEAKIGRRVPLVRSVSFVGARRVLFLVGQILPGACSGLGGEFHGEVAWLQIAQRERAQNADLRGRGATV